MKIQLNRRDLIKAAGVTALSTVISPQIASAASAPSGGAKPFGISRRQTFEVVHWSWLSASDNEVWKQAIDNFNEAHKGQGIQIQFEFVPDDQYGTKVLASAATGAAPDFGWGNAGIHWDWIKKGVVVSCEEHMQKVGLDLGDFVESTLQSYRYPDGKLYGIPLDAMSLQTLVNLDHAKAAGLDPASPPKTGDELLNWAEKMTVRQGDQVSQSGWLMTGSGHQPTVTWGVVAHQMGFRRASEDLKTAGINREAAKEAAQWVLDLFDKHKVATRDITDRYKAFGTGGGSMFLTGPWTLNGYVKQGMNFMTIPMSQVGKTAETYGSIGGQEMYVQTDASRYEKTAYTIKWLSDNSFLWTTQGRGAACRKSILNRPDYLTSGHPPPLRKAFIDGLANATIKEIPVTQAPDFQIYTAANFTARTMDPVWAKQTPIDTALDALIKQWQLNLDEG